MEPVSVIIPTYNRAALIPHTLVSVLAAVADGDEIIVVDDGSTDDTAAVVCAPDAPWSGRVRYLPMEHAGAGRSQNAGLAAARNDLIGFADSDDVWLPYRLELQRPIMESETSLGFCFSNFGQLWPDGSITPHWLVEWSRDTRSWDDILGPGRPYSDRWPLPAKLPQTDHEFRVHTGSLYLQLLRRACTNVNTLLARRSVVGDALHFGVDQPRYHDWECFARMARVGDCAYLDVDTALQRAHDGPRRTDSGPFIAAQSRITLIERTWASDPAFMQAHGDEVKAILAAQRRFVVRRLIQLNQRDQASKLLSELNGAYWERLALMVPHSILKALGRGE